jgi:hypothetical protein
MCAASNIDDSVKQHAVIIETVCGVCVYASEQRSGVKKAHLARSSVLWGRRQRHQRSRRESSSRCVRKGRSQGSQSKIQQITSDIFIYL